MNVSFFDSVQQVRHRCSIDQVYSLSACKHGASMNDHMISGVIYLKAWGIYIYMSPEALCWIIVLHHRLIYDQQELSFLIWQTSTALCLCVTQRWVLIFISEQVCLSLFMATWIDCLVTSWEACWVEPHSDVDPIGAHAATDRLSCWPRVATFSNDRHPSLEPVLAGQCCP